MRTILTSCLTSTIATLLALIHAQPAAALTTPNPYYGKTGYRPSSIIWGDSTTRRAYDEYRAGGFKGEINGTSSRSIEQLLPLVSERIRAKSPVRTAVIALGTNGGRGTFKRWQYVEAIRLLKRDGANRIVLLAPYRDATWWDTEKVAERAKWVREIADSQANVCVADWAAHAALHPELLEDGLHVLPASEPEYVKVVLDRALGPRENCV